VPVAINSFTALANVGGEHHDRLSVPDDIEEPVAIQRTVRDFDNASRWNCHSDSSSVLNQHG
jgi:hypothetical protein